MLGSILGSPSFGKLPCRFRTAIITMRAISDGEIRAIMSMSATTPLSENPISYSLPICWQVGLSSVTATQTLNPKPLQP